jgi:tRNA-dihydrouridine synthase B
VTAPLPQIGPYALTGRVLAAPMAGVTDLPFRRLCRRFGAALAAGEMMSADPRLWDSRKSRLRRIHEDEPEPRTVQIAGSDPRQMAEAARRNVEAGAQIIDLNMGCPAKKVCNRAAGSALLRDESLVEAILRAVVEELRGDRVPVTLKMRTGWSAQQRNGVTIARIAEDAGIAALAVHGRTRECRFAGAVEYATIAAIKSTVRIPVFANGDIDGVASARRVLAQTGADGVMIGRAALGRPWIFREIDAALREEEPCANAAQSAPATLAAGELRDTMLTHLRELYAFYGDEAGVRIARKHIDWYCRERAGSAAFRQAVMAADSAERQFAMVEEHLSEDHTPVTLVAAA